MRPHPKSSLTREPPRAWSPKRVQHVCSERSSSTSTCHCSTGPRPPIQRLLTPHPDGKDSRRSWLPASRPSSAHSVGSPSFSSRVLTAGAVSWTTESGTHSRLIADAHELNAEGVGQRVHEPAAPNADPAKAHFLLSFLLDDDVLLEVGEPPPGHAATVTFGAPTQRVVVVEADGSPSMGIRRRAYVSVSYDPNVLGREVAVSFLRDLARRVASLT